MVMLMIESNIKFLDIGSIPTINQNLDNLYPLGEIQITTPIIHT